MKKEIFYIILLFLVYDNNYSQSLSDLNIIYGNVLFGLNIDSLKMDAKITVEIEGNFKYSYSLKIDSLKRIKSYTSKYLSFDINYYPDSIVKKIYNFDRRYFNLHVQKQYVKEVYILKNKSIAGIRQYDLNTNELLLNINYSVNFVNTYEIITIDDGIEKWSEIFILNNDGEIKSWYSEFDGTIKLNFRKENETDVVIAVNNKLCTENKYLLINFSFYPLLEPNTKVGFLIIRY